MNARLSQLIATRAIQTRLLDNHDSNRRLLIETIYPLIAVSAYRGAFKASFSIIINDVVADILRSEGYTIRYFANLISVEWESEKTLDKNKDIEQLSLNEDTDRSFLP